MERYEYNRVINMLSAQQQVFVQALEDLDIAQVRRLLAEGFDPDFMEPEKGPAVSIWSDGLFKWWEKVCDAYEAGEPLTAEQKVEDLQPHLEILDELIKAKANFYLWDAEECYGPLWDAASAACTPAIQKLLDYKVDPNTKDEEGKTILSSISDLFFDCEFDQIDWSQALPEEKESLELLRSRGAKMSKEIA